MSKKKIEIIKQGRFLAFTALLLNACIILFSNSCTDFDDDFITNPSLRITFSRDTLSFDTIISELPTPTLEMKVYNPHNKPMRIDEVRLENAGSSGFRFNFDGRPGPVLTGSGANEIVIMPNDSTSLFVETTLRHTGAQDPVWSEDSICFSYNGIRQRVLLQAAAQDVKRLTRTVFAENTTLSSELPYLVYDTLRVEEGVTLTLPANTRIYFYSNACLKVEGTLVTEGTQSEPVVMRGHRTDNLFTNVPYDRVPGQWGGIILTETSFDNHLKYTNIRNTFNALDIKASTPDNLKIKIENSVIHNASSDIINAVNCRIEAYNSQFSNAGNAVFNIAGGDLLIKHCTLANYFHARWGQRRDQTLVLSNRFFAPEDGSESLYPLLKADFYNTIIYGSGAGEVALRKKEGTGFSYLFDHCLLKSKGNDDSDIEEEKYINNVWYSDLEGEQRRDSSLFVSLGTDILAEKLNYYYDFHIKEKSAARQKANLSISEELPYDMDNTNRLDTEIPDIGAYEWLPSAAE